MLNWFPNPAKSALPKNPLENEKKSMNHSPGYKIPTCAMPKSGKEKNDKEIYIGSNIPNSITTQRNIKIIPEESRQ